MPFQTKATDDNPEGYGRTCLWYITQRIRNDWWHYLCSPFSDMQDGLIEVGQDDITTNLPYVEGVFIFLTTTPVKLNVWVFKRKLYHWPESSIRSTGCLWLFWGKSCFPRVPDEMMEAVDKADRQAFTKEDVLNPQGWELYLLMDARTGTASVILAFQTINNDATYRFLPRNTMTSKKFWIAGC